MEEKKEPITELKEVPAKSEPIVAELVEAPEKKKNRKFPNLLIHAAVKQKVCELFAEGKTFREVQAITGIHHSSIDNARIKDPEFNLSFTQARRMADQQVEKALWQRAKGMKIRESTETIDSQGRTETKNVIKEIPPDTEAGKFWLSRRRPAEWADNQIHQQNQTLNIITLSGKRVEIKK